MCQAALFAWTLPCKLDSVQRIHLCSVDSNCLDLPIFLLITIMQVLFRSQRFMNIRMSQKSKKSNRPSLSSLKQGACKYTALGPGLVLVVFVPFEMH